MSKEHFADTTYSIAKAFNNLTIARQYLDDAKRSNKGAVKDLFNSYILKIDWIINNVSSRLSSESRKILNEELSDSLCLDAINDNLMHLSLEDRLRVEHITNSMKKGEKIIIEQLQNY